MEHLLHISRTVAKSSPCDQLRLVTATRTRDVQLIEVSEDHEFRRVLYEVLCKDYIVLGLLGFEDRDGEIPALRFLFPWHSEDPRLCKVFDVFSTGGEERGGGAGGQATGAVNP